MLDMSNFWGEGNSTPMGSYLSVMQEIHVLLVDHEQEALVSTSKVLELCQYKVSVFELASGAITMISNGKVKVDFVMANINSPDLQGFKLLQLAVNMGIPVILMSVDDNHLMAMRAIENGAFLYIKKPANVEMLRCLWQHIAREKMRATREAERLMAANYANRGVEIRDVVQLPNPELPNNMLMPRDNGRWKKSYNYYKGRNGGERYDSDMMSLAKVKRKVCTEWTQELHEKFMRAVEELGEGRCFPKEILELMNVTGLTRMQVASHLQKCRNDNWRSPEERRVLSNAYPQSSDSEGSKPRPRRFGSMPRLGRGSSYHLQTRSEGGEGSKAPSELEMANGGGTGNMGTEGSVMPIATNYQQQQEYGALVPHPSNGAPGITSANPSQPTDDYFCFQEMDSLIQNYAGVPHVSAGMSQPNSGSGGYHFDPIYGQHSNGPSMDDGGQWANSDHTDFGSDDSQTREHK